MKKIVKTDLAPDPVGPYNQAIVAGNLVFTAGQIALDPATSKFVGDDVATQARQVLKNLQAVLQAAGADFSSVVKTTIFLKSMDDFQAVNAVYGEYFNDAPPARSTVEASRLPKDALVEIECIAVVTT